MMEQDASLMEQDASLTERDAILMDFDGKKADFHAMVQRIMNPVRSYFATGQAPINDF